MTDASLGLIGSRLIPTFCPRHCQGAQQESLGQCVGGQHSQKTQCQAGARNEKACHGRSQGSESAAAQEHLHGVAAGKSPGVIAMSGAAGAGFIAR